MTNLEHLVTKSQLSALVPRYAKLLQECASHGRNLVNAVEKARGATDMDPVYAKILQAAKPGVKAFEKAAKDAFAAVSQPNKAGNILAGVIRATFAASADIQRTERFKGELQRAGDDNLVRFVENWSIAYREAEDLEGDIREFIQDNIKSVADPVMEAIEDLERVVKGATSSLSKARSMIDDAAATLTRGQQIPFYARVGKRILSLATSVDAGTVPVKRIISDLDALIADIESNGPDNPRGAEAVGFLQRARNELRS